jgi:hypothetical protein
MTAVAEPSTVEWSSENQRRLVSELARVRRLLERHAGGPEVESGGAGTPESAGSFALDAVCSAFELSPFERDVLLMCAGVELDAGFAEACALASGRPERAGPTFALALAALGDPHWSALAPAAPLRHWRLVEVDPAESLTAARLRIDERVLHYLAGVGYLDERLHGVVSAAGAPSELPPSQLEVAIRVAEVWRASRGEGVRPLVQLGEGSDGRGARAVAGAAAAMIGAGLCTIRAAAVPLVPGERETIARLWEREAALSGSALLLEADGDERPAVEAAAALLDTLSGPVAVAGMEPGGGRAVLRLPVPRASGTERREMWRAAVAAEPAPDEGELAAVAGTFDLDPAAMQAAVLEWQAGTGRSLWELCRSHARPRMSGLAQRIEPTASWHDIVLPAHARALLEQIATQVRGRTRVYEEWGFGGRGLRGLGIGALFAGPSGTGKTMAAEVLAAELELDLYRIDLSSVVSKYIGETEKNLRRVFDYAEEGSAVLLFDEADALFGKRSEVKDSHDRYANIEVSYLLQRMEAYRGLAILTTNLRGAIDTAFLRRVRFVVTFGFPGVAERAEMWRRAFPPGAPTEGIDPDRLAQLEVSGASIRNIALGGAFLAAGGSEPVRMSHLLAAARAEAAKLEELVSPAEVGGWT